VRPRAPHHTNRPVPAVRRGIRVFVVDDHPVVREGVKQLVAETSDLVVAGEAATPGEALAALHEGSWDVAIVDLSMPGVSGLELLQQVKRDRPELPVVILSMHAENQFAVRALKAGAAGYVTKESTPEELVRAIRKVYGGGTYVSATLAEKLATDLSRGARSGAYEALSAREFEVLRQLGAGRAVKQIARALHLSEKTVSTYRTRVLKKLDLTTTAAVIRYALEHRLID